MSFLEALRDRGRQSGAGTFQDQIVPYIQGIAPPLAVLTSLILISDQLND